MADFPAQLAFMAGKPSITPYSPLSLGGGGSLSSQGSATFPVANVALLIPFRLPGPRTVYSFGVYNGSAVSGNWDIGLYTLDGRRIVSTGSVVMSGGTSHQQAVLGTPTGLGPLAGYLAFACDNTTAQFLRQAPGLQLCQALGMAQAASAFPLPATITPASLANAYIPGLAAYLRGAP